MKIKGLHLENFRKHADSVLTFGDAGFVVIRGKNFAGKSTVGQAISMCFTPSTTGLDAAGRGFVSKIKRGASKAVITADLQGKRHLIQRTVTLNTNSTGRTQRSICLSDPDWRPDSFDRQIEENRAALTVVLNSDAFLRMDEKEQKNLLARLALPVRYDFDQRIVAAVEKMLGRDAPNFESEPFEVISDAYTKLFAERTIANRQVKDFVVPETLPMPAGDSRALDQQLTELRGERKQRVEERDKAVADATQLEMSRVRAKARITSLEAAVRHEQEKLDYTKGKLQPDDKLAYLRKVAAGKDELEKLHKEHTEKTKLLYADESQLMELRKARGNKVCPTCTGPLDHDKLSALGIRLERQISEGREAVRFLEQRIKAIGDVGTAVELIAGHEKVLKDLVPLVDAVAKKQKELEAAQQEVPEAQEFDFQPYDRSITECDEMIERLAGALRPAIAAEERAKEIAVKKEQLSRLKDRAAALDELVKYFDKDGIKATLLKQYIGGFENKVNEVMAAWGYSCSLIIEPYAFDVTNADGDTVPVRELSGAERVMFSLAFQCAVARTANIGLVVIDEVTMLLPEIRPAIYRRLYKMLSDNLLEQIILLVADSSTEVPDLPGSAFFMVSAGVVEKLSVRG